MNKGETAVPYFPDSGSIVRTLSAIRKQVETLGTRINAPRHLYPTYGYSMDGARPHIEIDPTGNLQFVVVERGQELERQSTAILDDLLFWIFDTITFSMACTFESKNRNRAQDFRRILFSEQEALLGRINVAWQEKKRDQHTLILAKHPFTDGIFNS